MQRTNRDKGDMMRRIIGDLPTIKGHRNFFEDPTWQERWSAIL